MTARPKGEDWIERELNDFTAGPNGANVVAIRGAGDFDGPLPGDLKLRFPNIEIVDFRGAGPFCFLNPTRAARLTAEKLKMVAPLLDIPVEEMPRLRQEEERRQQARMGAVMGGALGVLAAVTSLSVFALESRNEAVRAAEDSMYAAGSMVLRATDLKSDDATTAELRRLIINQGCDLIDKFRNEAINEPQITETVRCRLERAQHYESRHEYSQATKQFREAIEIASDRHRQSGRMDAALAIIKVRQSFAEYLKRKNDAPEAEAEYKSLLEDARRLGKDHDEHHEFSRSEGEALGILGDFERARSNWTGASGLYDQAADAVGRSIDARSKPGMQPDPHMVAWLIRLHRLSGQQHMRLADVEHAIEDFHRATDVRSKQMQQSTLGMEYETAWAQALLFSLEQNRNHADVAKTARDEAFKSIDAISNSPNASDTFKKNALEIRQWIEARIQKNDESVHR